MVLQQIKMILLQVIGLFRRALCCFTRRRKQSFSEPLQNIVVDSSAAQRQHQPMTKHAERAWDSWDDSPRTVEEHIEQYRQRIAKPATPPKEEPEPDFFTDLTPVIKPQLKVYLGDESTVQERADFSRLKAKTDVPIAINADLEDWDDEETGGWEDHDKEETKQMIREKRREMRSQRQKTNKVSGIEQDPSGIGATRLNANQQPSYPHPHSSRT